MRTIPLTARQPRSYTPPSLRARYAAELDVYDARERARRANEGKPDALRKTLPDGPDTPPVMPIIFLAVPTLLERDTIGSLMFELGVIQVTRESIRNVMLEEAFEVYGEEKGEEVATFLETFWQQQEVFEDRNALWGEQERQRLLDEWGGGDKRDPAPLPEHDSPLRSRLRAKREVDQLVALSGKVRRLLGQQTDYARQNATMLARTHCRGWEGLATQREAIGADLHGGYPAAEVLTEECTGALREEIGTQAWQELCNEIDDSYNLSAAEVGNSGSPLVTSPSGAGSIEEEGAAGEPSGDSPGTIAVTKSSSTRRPKPASGPTTTQ